MFTGIKRSISSIVCASLVFLLNGLMFMNLPGNPEQNAFGIFSGKKIFLLLLCVDLAVLIICAAYARLTMAENSFKGTAVLLILSPLVEFLLLETMTGHLAELPTAAIGINLLIAYIVLGMFLLFFGSVRRALVFFNSWMPFLGLVQYYVYMFRGRSFMLSDVASILTAVQVAGGYSYSLDFTVAAAAVIAVGWEYLSLITPDRKTRKFFWIRKLTVVLLCVVSVNLLSDTAFASRHNVLKMNMWDTENDYRMKGYLLNLLAQIQYLTVDPPENYSADAAAEAVEKYSRMYDEGRENLENEASAAVRPVNLIIIMNESWSDFRITGKFQCSEPVTPYIDQMEKNVTKGWVSVPSFGGGTANTEYEMLTGNSTLLFEDTTAVAYQVYSQKNEYGLASTLSAQDYQTLALHPMNPLNYNREQVYAAMRFDEFISLKNWIRKKKMRRKLRGFVSDNSCYKYLEYIYGSKKESTNLFSFLVTMQNHAGYINQKYKSTVSLEYDDRSFPETEQYLSLIKESDTAFGNLIAEFEKVQEPTMIVMFGDHWPNLQDDFYSLFYENNTPEENVEIERRRFLTPFVIWTNYDRESAEDVVMSSNYFGSYILEQAGAQLTDYNKFLLEMKNQMPVIQRAEVMDSEGVWHLREDLPEKLQELLNAYEIVQYNNVFAGKDKIDFLFTLQSGN